MSQTPILDLDDRPGVFTDADAEQAKLLSAQLFDLLAARQFHAAARPQALLARLGIDVRPRAAEPLGPDPVALFARLVKARDAGRFDEARRYHSELARAGWSVCPRGNRRNGGAE